jgi:hypothetical protein
MVQPIQATFFVLSCCDGSAVSRATMAPRDDVIRGVSRDDVIRGYPVGAQPVAPARLAPVIN